MYGADEREARRAVARLAALGFTDVTVLEGGLEGWAASGGELFEDVNSASKAFGELVAERAATPFVDAVDLLDRQRAGEAPVVLDARRFEEYRTMSIPGATSVPGAELVLRAPALARTPATEVVVNEGNTP